MHIFFRLLILATALVGLYVLFLYTFPLHQLPRIHPNRLTNLPTETYPEQIQYTMQFKDKTFALVSQPDASTNIHPRNHTYSWSGLLVSSDNGQTWQKTFISPTGPNSNGHPVVYNPAGISYRGNRLFVVVKNDQAGGSGEGYCMTYTTTYPSLSGWHKLPACRYYVPEYYHSSNHTFSDWWRMSLLNGMSYVANPHLLVSCSTL
jgi:hypothetical protein